MKYLISLVLALSMTQAVSKPDLEGKPLIAEGVCLSQGRQAYCALILDGDTLYLAIHHGEGRVTVYKVIETPPDGIFQDRHLELVSTLFNV